jgi:flavin-dependent dehydrogenase
VLAIHLRKRNKRVVVVDSCSMPSDQPMSTHFIGSFGMALLDELGLGDKVRAFAPPVPQFVNGIDDVLVRIEFPPERRGCCPRRRDLDPLLVDEARAAGTEVLLRTKLVDLVREDDRVVGGVVERERGREEIRADVVVGADGRHSTIAKLVGAEEYNGLDFPRAAYWAYWPRPATYRTDPRYQGAAMILYRGEDFIFVFPTNKDQLLVGCGFPKSRLSEWKGRHKDKLHERLRADELIAPLTPGEPLEDVVGLLKARSFFRQAAGRGWALVGDAGLHKDPSPGLGISDALRDARALAEAIAAGGDAALELYWRKRDVVACELFHSQMTWARSNTTTPST